jgi:hypothetical protein
VLEQIRGLKDQGLPVAAKYHPRNSNPDALDLVAVGVELIPSGISFEDFAA